MGACGLSFVNYKNLEDPSKFASSRICSKFLTYSDGDHVWAVHRIGSGSIGKTPLPTSGLPFGTKNNKWGFWITTTCWGRAAGLYFQYVRSHCKYSCLVTNVFVRRVVLYLLVCTIYSSLLSLAAWLFVVLQIMIPMAHVWVQQKHNKVKIIGRIDHEWNGCYQSWFVQSHDNNRMV